MRERDEAKAALVTLEASGLKVIDFKFVHASQRLASYVLG
jgi:hypothetical protein